MAARMCNRIGGNVPQATILWAVGLFAIVVEVSIVWCLACELGFRLGEWRKRDADHRANK